ncbi:MAG: hypothetical protein WCY11_03305 [Novosphingobium sp.]
MPADSFSGYTDSPTAPASACFAIVPSDSLDLATVTKAIYVGTGGDVVLCPLNGTVDVTFRNVPDGGILDVRARAVRSSGTTAADIVGLA